MTACLVLAFALSQAPSIDGLRPGESAVRLAPRTAAEERAMESFVVGRVVDAETGLPIEGATVECWTEEIDRQSAGFERVGEATSGVDGGFAVRARDGAIAAGKARVRAGGYLALSTTTSELELVRLVRRRGDAPIVRIVDLEGRPISGARVTSTYSCAHDLPAFEVETDALGVARLDEYGLQDATPELRVRAAGYGALKYVEPERVLAKGAVLRLARRASMRARLVDERGAALTGRALHVEDGEGFHVLHTASDGRFEIASPYGGGEVTVFLFEAGGERHVFSGRIPDGFEPNLRVPSQSDGDALASATLRIELPELGDDLAIPIEIFHARGWSTTLEARGAEPIEVDVPPGELALVAGGAFSGWDEAVLEFELAAGERATRRIDARREPTLSLALPAGVTRLVVQAGDDSIELEPKEGDEPRLAVPAGREIVVLAEGVETRRAVLPPLARDARLDLRVEGEVVESPREPAPRGSIEVVAFDERGAPLEGELSVRGFREPAVERIATGRFRVDAARGLPLFASFEAPWRARCERSIDPATDASPIELRPAALASLRVEPEGAFAIEAPETDLAALHPGPLRVVLRSAAGERIGLALELAPGEARVLRVR